MLEPLEINGEPPELAGLRCEELLCQEFWCRDERVDPANVSYLKCDGRWHRLYFDCGIIFWRTNEDRPEAWSAPEVDWVYPLVDVAERFSLKNAMVESVETESIEGGSRVSLI